LRTSIISVRTKRAASAIGDRDKAMVGKTVEAKPSRQKAIGNQAKTTAKRNCKTTAKTKLGTERPAMAKTEVKLSIQVFW